MEALPKDPIMLMSVVNTKLRDFYPTLDALCEDLSLQKDILIDTLKTAGFTYHPETNQFR